jgi:hypothetical protein
VAGFPWAVGHLNPSMENWAKTLYLGSGVISSTTGSVSTLHRLVTYRLLFVAFF